MYKVTNVESKLKKIRLSAMISQTELSMASNVPRYVISNAEYYGIYPPKSQQERLAKALGVTQKVLFPVDKETRSAKNV